MEIWKDECFNVSIFQHFNLSICKSVLRVNKWSDYVSIIGFVLVHQDERFLVIDDIEDQFFALDDLDEVRDVFPVDSETQ